MTQQDKNRKFIKGYKLTGDGSLADRFMAGCKRSIAEYDALTPEQREESRKHYKEKMREIVNEAAKDWPMPEVHDE